MTYITSGKNKQTVYRRLIEIKRSANFYYEDIEVRKKIYYRTLFEHNKTQEEFCNIVRE